MHVNISEITGLFLLGFFLSTEVFPQPFRFFDHTQLTHTVGLLWASDQPVAEDSTYTGQHNIETQETTIHALSGIRTRAPSNQDLRLRPRGYRGRQTTGLTNNIFISKLIFIQFYG
jgi:hypothetical protein